VKRTLGVLIIVTEMLAGSANAALAPLRSVSASSKVIQETVDKKVVLDRLKALRDKQLSQVTTLDASIHKKLEETASMGLATDSLIVADHRTSQLADQIQELSKKKDEANARREIVDRLIFMVDTKYTNQPFRNFLEQQFVEMAANDLADGRDGRLWKALTYLSICVREVPEPREDVLDVVEGYLDYTSVLSPKTPADFLASRNYMNGSQSEAATTVSRDKAADDIEVPLLNQVTAKATPEPNMVPVTPTLPDPDTISGTTVGPDVAPAPAATTAPAAPTSKN
jgi:hypothetical protein